MDKQQYEAYRKTAEWRQRRESCLGSYDYRCQVCGCTSWRRPVDVHHLHYRNVGNEKPEDLIPLCSVHHSLIHNQPDGYDRKVVSRLLRECTEDNWGDPYPARVRERMTSHDNPAQKLATLLKERENGEMVDNADIDNARRQLGAPILGEDGKKRMEADFLGVTRAWEMNEIPFAWTKVGRK